MTRASRCENALASVGSSPSKIEPRPTGDGPRLPGASAHLPKVGQGHDEVVAGLISRTGFAADVS
jgi:hypothetical protein